MKTTSVEIKDFQKGIADSPHLGFADMRNVNIDDQKGIVSLNVALQAASASPVSTTFTVNSGTEVATISATTFQWLNGNATGRAVTVSSTTTLPAPLVAGTTYFLIDVSSTTFKFATTLANALAGTPIDLTDTGTGTHTITSINMGGIKHFAEDNATFNIYGLDNNGRVWATFGGQGSQSSFDVAATTKWYLVAGNSLTNASGNGLAIYQKYIIVFRDAKIDVAATSTNTTWTNDWQSLNATAGTSAIHKAKPGQDNILYFADINNTSLVPFIGAIGVVGSSAFNPAGTINVDYTFNSQALTLPAYKTITDLDELGVNLMIATMGREIYPWNRSSTSFSLPIIAAETNISAIKTMNNVLYFAAGKHGTIYATVGSSTRLIRRVPKYITGSPYNSVNIGAMVGHKGKLFFSVECIGCSGIWSINLDTGALIMENVLSIGTYSTSAAHTISALYSINQEAYMVGWRDSFNSISGLDSTLVNGTQSNYYYQTSYGGYVDSYFVAVGNSISPETFSNVIVELAKPLTTGQGVRVSYRKDLTSSFTVIGTLDFATYAGEQSFVLPAPITDADFVQIRTELTVPATSITTPELRIIIIN